MKNKFSFTAILKIIAGTFLLGVGLLGLFTLIIVGYFSKSDYYMTIGCLSFGVGLFLSALSSKPHEASLRIYSYLYLVLGSMGLFAFFTNDLYVDIVPSLALILCFLIVIGFDIFGIFKIIKSFLRKSH